ncbi:hypothetical protein QBC40DRAFT_195060 [Triangularia verruculosa]|uniref:Uncharacterized protein n=1 Tax=Triangularia verruculosa TaxID=2587418 RepID=A0AAN6XNL6_9PEZI|nr:hypothetical protein QBC40DRAFT_195060 [Triangularia verruculosa]
MPPRSAAVIDDSPTALTLILKHGIASVFLFASPSWTFEKLSTELLEILRDRYPEGLATSTEPESTVTPIPADDADVKVVFGTPRDVDDHTKGFKKFDVGPTDTLGTKGLKKVTTFAFALLGPDQDEDGPVKFEVAFPANDVEA